MFLLMVSWLIIGIIAFLVLGKFIIKTLSILWEIFMPILNRKPIDFQATFGEWAVVTGSTDGIGKAFAIELAEKNMNLMLISRNTEKLKNTKDELLLRNPNIEVQMIAADFSKGKEAIDKIKSQLQNVSIGILINNVGKMYEYPMYLGEVPEQDLLDIININVGATTLMTRLVIGQMQKRGRGAIVNISSGSEFQPLPLMTVYAASKVYIKSFSAALRAEYSQFGITVQHLTPYFITTKMNAYSERLQVASFFVPDATTYVKNAITALGKLDNSAGYWSHSLHKFVTTILPVEYRMKLGNFITGSLRKDYFKQQEKKTS